MKNSKFKVQNCGMKTVFISLILNFTLLTLNLLAGPLTGGGAAQKLGTIQDSAKLVTAVDANDTPLDVNTVGWYYAQSGTPIPANFNGLKVMLYTYDPNDANDATFKYKFYVAGEFGSWEPVADGNATVGYSQLSHNPVTGTAFQASELPDPNYLWVDTLDETIVTKWMGGVTPQNYTGLNVPAAFIFDRQNACRMKCIITDRSSAFLSVWCVAYGY
jgi:hypothetical protein